MLKTHILGFPRLGPNREYKKSLEAYWSGKINADQLHTQGAEIRKTNWNIQAKSGLDYVTVGDFAWYDHMLNLSLMAGVIPARFANDDAPGLDTMFRMARGRAPSGKDAQACEMTKWFNTNYHYIVPELNKDQEFSLTYAPLLNEISEARQEGHKVKAVLPGPLTYLWLAKCNEQNGGAFDKLTLLSKLTVFYGELLAKIKQLGAEWVQIDEPILALDLNSDWQAAFRQAYATLDSKECPSLLLTVYFGELRDNLDLLKQLPVAGMHLDATCGEEWKLLADTQPDEQVLSVGAINGRNIWRANLSSMFTQLREHAGKRNNLWVGSSCSLMHCPVNLESESNTFADPEMYGWFAFATQKCKEVSVLGKGLAKDLGKGLGKGISDPKDPDVQKAIEVADRAIASRRNSDRIHKQDVAERMQQITPAMMQRNSAFTERSELQRKVLNLPNFPTTTIGSFPQTAEIRRIRGEFKRGRLDRESYRQAMRAEIKSVTDKQLEMQLDVLVHGEPERNDMVEYFGELLDGTAITANGWVQSYGSRCVKPPIIYGDISRPKPMTAEWSVYAQSLTDRPMKAMLTGPVTILCWSFVRDDVPRKQTASQLGLALRDEVADLEKNGLRIIQIDEPALREGLPLRKNDWAEYLDWAVAAFRLASSVAKDETQIHSHMCYSEFNDIIDSIAKLDADVISIECSRSKMELLNVFDTFKYPNDIGPGVYDIHSPLIPNETSMEELLRLAAKRIDPQRLWVNPDCGLKTRQWKECTPALKNMVAAAKTMRKQYV